MSLILIGIKILTVKNPVCNGFFLSMVNGLVFFLSDILYEKSISTIGISLCAGKALSAEHQSISH